MFIKQLYTACLSEAAYYIESNGEAAIIDPLRDINVYVELAAERKAVIRYIFETHFHADFISGHLDLSKASAAPIVFGPGTQTRYPIHVATDGETFTLGNISLEVLHTPGHTIESSCYLLRDENGNPHALFTGDTLFINDVGRPDLSSGNLEKEELASMMYDSIQQKILPLPDSVLVYPAHGPGSSCGKNLGPETVSTLGEQKVSNYALNAHSREDFIKSLITGLDEPPQYFAMNARINKEGYESIDSVLTKGLTPLSVEAFKAAIDKELLVLDTRKSVVFTHGFIPGSINIGLEGRFAEWAASMLPFNTPIVMVTDEGKEEESLVRLARVGFDKVQGYLKGGYESWTAAGEETDMVIDVEADELAMDIPFDENLVVVDVRRETEFADGHIKDALNLPLNDMTDPANLAALEEHQNLYLHCGGGYRSVIAASVLKRQGIHNLRNVLGGWDKIKEQKGIQIVKESSVLN
jgi:hydroxyacylglutathione hydrolase